MTMTNDELLFWSTHRRLADCLVCGILAIAPLYTCGVIAGRVMGWW
jgi:hypothetical protein